MERFDILGLQAFVGVAEQGSFRLAAERLNLSATAVSRRLQKLEDTLGVVLVSRTTRLVTLTRTGAEFLPRAQEVLSSLEGAISDLRAQSHFGAADVRIACLPTIAAQLLPRIIAEFPEDAANRVQITDLSAMEILERVRDKRADFGISFIGADHFDLIIEPLFSEPVVALVRADHPLAAKGTITWQGLEGERLISIGQRSGTRRLIQTALQSHSIALDWVYDVQHLATAVSLAAAGVGIAVLPAIAGEMVTPPLTPVGLTEPRVERAIGLIRRNDMPLSPPARLMREIVMKRLKRASGGR
ncbi:LysR substrate-binding domain-containing protein [Acuticoccus sp. M5D2P5]|uniref:LysR family transcriptional regulator n=1 Tax=Acuticoccus kalidii TaxID=2910977 RepID=UPI001F2A0E87|nr:LysR family transcriptional regulator [Acuticoccus kalidii]MCF3935564.1 LysR substrate-binding domain-containing protein [Acuticoccus kalidii]